MVGGREENSLENHEYLTSADVRESLTQVHTENAAGSPHTVTHTHCPSQNPQSLRVEVSNPQLDPGQLEQRKTSQLSSQLDFP